MEYFSLYRKANESKECYHLIITMQTSYFTDKIRMGIECISLPEEDTEPQGPPKQTTTERNCSTSLEKHHKIGKQQFDDVSG